MWERTYVGLDVHARSVVGHALDESTGEVWQQRLPTDPPGIWGWLESLPQPVKVGPDSQPSAIASASLISCNRSTRTPISSRVMREAQRGMRIDGVQPPLSFASSSRYKAGEISNCSRPSSA